MKRGKLVFLLLIVLFFVSCEGFWIGVFNSITRNLDASDGSYADRIELSWSDATDLDQDEDGVVDAWFVTYELYRGTSEYSLTLLETTSSTTYDDYAITPGRYYYYRVEAVYDDTTQNWEAEDSGFAMDADTLQSYSSSSAAWDNAQVNHSQSQQTQWFVFLQQESWEYTAATAGTGTYADIYVYRTSDIENVVYGTAAAGYSSVSWTAWDSEVCYIKVISDNSFSMACWFSPN